MVTGEAQTEDPGRGILMMLPNWVERQGMPAGSMTCLSVPIK